jgi:hypothetical protein
MKKLALTLLAAASLLGTAGIASAQYYYGGGYDPYYRGGSYPGPYYRDYYGDRGYYRGGGYYGRRSGRGCVVGGRWYPCPCGFTVQDGVCKPYRGY